MIVLHIYFFKIFFVSNFIKCATVRCCRQNIIYQTAFVKLQFIDCFTVIIFFKQFYAENFIKLYHYQSHVVFSTSEFGLLSIGGVAVFICLLGLLSYSERTNNKNKQLDLMSVVMYVCSWLWWHTVFLNRCIYDIMHTYTHI